MMKECTKCHQVKPLSDFGPDPRKADGHHSGCNACKAALARARRSTIPAEVKAEASAAYRAGMRKDRCAVCKGPVRGQGLCEACQGHVEALGGLEGLKAAVRAVRYLTTRK